MDKYRKGIVTFLDVLGFSDLVAASDAATVHEKLDAVEHFTRPQYNSDDESTKDFEPRIFQFSDSIVRVRLVDTKTNKEYPMGHLFHELLDLLYAQVDLIREGVLIRGGVTFGDVSVSESRVFGPAVITAYEMESRYALYPRIVLSPGILSELKKNRLLRSSNLLEDECDYIRKLICQGDDGMWFIDYARAIETELDEIEMYPVFLKMHRELILKGAGRFKSMNSVLNKYMWLATYHNSVINNLTNKWFKHYSTTRRKHSITTRDLPLIETI